MSGNMASLKQKYVGCLAQQRENFPSHQPALPLVKIISVNKHISTSHISLKVERCRLDLSRNRISPLRTFTARCVGDSAGEHNRSKQEESSQHPSEPRTNDRPMYVTRTIIYIIVIKCQFQILTSRF
jgi:hypothetical protein